MRRLSMAEEGAADLLAAAYGAISDVVSGLRDGEFATATGCDGWAVDALLFHVMLDAQRALMALAQPIDATPDTDAVSYWQQYVADLPSEPEPGRTSFAVDSAAAYGRPTGLVTHWRDLTNAAIAAASRADPAATIATQGHLMRVDDFLDTLVVEATIHHLDLVSELEADKPPTKSMRLTRARLDELLGQPTPRDWDDARVIEVLTGRATPTADELAALGRAASRIPVIR